MKNREFLADVARTADALRYRTWRAELWIGKAVLALLGQGEQIDVPALEAWLRMQRAAARSAKDKDAIDRAISVLGRHATEGQGRDQ